MAVAVEMRTIGGKDADLCCMHARELRGAAIRVDSAAERRDGRIGHGEAKEGKHCSRAVYGRCCGCEMVGTVA